VCNTKINGKLLTKNTNNNDNLVNLSLDLLRIDIFHMSF